VNLVLLTTQTSHHTFFARELAEAFPLARIVVETKEVKPPFETFHPFERKRDEHERQVFFNGREINLAQVAPTIEVESINSPQGLAALAGLKPEAVVVFGTAKLRAEAIRICPEGMVNLHGGDPERYRGLDTHLWAIYHGDYSGLVTTLHRVNQELDDGEIIAQGPVPINKGMGLHELRERNTQVCLELTLAGLEMFSRLGRFVSRPQQGQGRYYSFMPAPLKEICFNKFQRFTAGRS